MDFGVSLPPHCKSLLLTVQLAGSSERVNMIHLHAEKSPTLDTAKLLHRDFWLNYVRKLQEFQGNSCHLSFIGS